MVMQMGLTFKEMDDKLFMLYMADIIDKLQTWKYEVFTIKNLDREIWGKAPCNIDSHAIFVEAIKRAKPEIYSKDKKSLKQMFEEAEDYLHKRFNKKIKK